MRARNLAPIRRHRQHAVVAVSPDSIRVDMYEDEGTDRAVAVYTLAEADQLITDLQRAVIDAMRMET